MDAHTSIDSIVSAMRVLSEQNGVHVCSGDRQTDRPTNKQMNIAIA